MLGIFSNLMESTFPADINAEKQAQKGERRA